MFVLLLQLYFVFIFASTSFHFSYFHFFHFIYFIRNIILDCIRYDFTIFVCRHVLLKHLSRIYIYNYKK